MDSTMSMKNDFDQTLDTPNTPMERTTSGSTQIFETKRIKKQSKKKKVQKLLKKPYGIVVPRLLEMEHKFLIRGDIIIDIESIKRDNVFSSNSMDYKDYKPPRSIKYIKDLNFYQIEFGRIQNPIRDFSFIINMLNSLGDAKIHYLAEQLQEYKNVFDEIDHLQSRYRVYPSRQEVDLALKSNVCTLYRPDNDGEWTYEMSLNKASQIIQTKLANNKFMFYTILKGNFDQYEIALLSVCEQALKLIFGNISRDEITKILLENGLMMMNRNVLELIQNRKQANQSQFSGISMDKEYFTFTKDITCYSVNNYLFQLSVQFERFKLSNYKDRFNDQLVIGLIQDDQILNLANQLFIQKVFTNPSPDEREMLANIGYSAQSECFIEKFYPEFCNKNPEEIKALLKKQQQKQQQAAEEEDDYSDGQSSQNKQCGYRILINL